MKSKVKALAVDIDGTLTDENRILHCQAVEMLRKVKIPIILATGNSTCFAKAAAKLIGVTDIIICENGGVVRIKYDQPEIVLGNKNLCIKAAKFLERFFKIIYLDLEDRKSEVCIKRNFPIEKAKELLNKEFRGKVKILDSKFAYHIVDSGVSKGKALEFIANIINVPMNNIAAIGDSENDIDMLKKSGIGLAVANADIKLKEVADIILTKNNGEGVIEALKLLNLV